MKLAIYGSGGSGCELYDLATRCNNVQKKWDKIVFIDDFKKSKHEYLADIIKFDDLVRNKNDYEVVISLGEPASRKALYEKLKKENITLAKLIDPTAIVSSSATIGEGTILSEYTVIHCNVKIGKNCLMQPYTGLGHGSVTGNHCVFSSHFSPGGDCKFGDCVYCGLHSIIKEKLTIGGNAVVSMGACVFHDVAEDSVVIGNPARPSIKNTSGKVFRSL